MGEEVHLTIDTGRNGPICELERLKMILPETVVEMFGIPLPKRVHGVQHGFCMVYGTQREARTAYRIINTPHGKAWLFFKNIRKSNHVGQDQDATVDRIAMYIGDIWRTKL